MKKIICLAVGVLALNCIPVFGEPNGSPTPPPSETYQERLRAIVKASTSPQKQPPELTKFNLNFPGGTPAQLVKAIEKATGKRLNVIIPAEGGNAQLPALMMNHVNVVQMFQALRAVSPVQYVGRTAYPENSFNTSAKIPSDDSIWYFTVHKYVPPSQQKICHFFSLAPYLNRGFTVDDITTAIQTGWKLAGIIAPPKLEYHKETKLLIAFGEPDRLGIIQQVLGSLPATNASRREIDTMKADIQRLQSQVDRLTLKVSELPPIQTASPREKPGK